jgi:hypothetical protein
VCVMSLSSVSEARGAPAAWSRAGTSDTFYVVSQLSYVAATVTRMRWPRVLIVKGPTRPFLRTRRGSVALPNRRPDVPIGARTQHQPDVRGLGVHPAAPYQVPARRHDVRHSARAVIVRARAVGLVSVSSHGRQCVCPWRPRPHENRDCAPVETFLCARDTHRTTLLRSINSIEPFSKEDPPRADFARRKRAQAVRFEKHLRTSIKAALRPSFVCRRNALSPSSLRKSPLALVRRGRTTCTSGPGAWNSPSRNVSSTHDPRRRWRCRCATRKGSLGRRPDH